MYCMIPDPLPAHRLVKGRLHQTNVCWLGKGRQKSSKVSPVQSSLVFTDSLEGIPLEVVVEGSALEVLVVRGSALEVVVGGRAFGGGGWHRRRRGGAEGAGAPPPQYFSSGGRAC